MAYDINITAGSPPLLWSDVNDAFTKINGNFQILQAALGANGITPVDFSYFSSNLIPSTDALYSLGATSKKFKAVFTSSYFPSAGESINGVWLGDAHIKGISTYIDIPADSTVNGELIIDPDKTFFKTIEVDGSDSVVAQQFNDTVELLSGDGVQLSVAGSSITFDNTGVLSIANGSGITHSTVSGVATITNSGVRSLQSTTALPSGRTAGAGINIDNSTGDNIKITNAGVISISAGVGITVSADTATGEVQITNSAPAVNTFSQIEVNGDSSNRLLADAVSDVLNITSGQGITLTKTPSTDTLTITVNPVFDLQGSVFGDDSTKIVDAVENKVYATFFGNLTGNVTGNADSSTVTGTVDITNTNGLTTVYYPTFVENRTTGQIVRADVDLTYRTDTNTLTAPTFSGNLTGNVTGNIFTNLIDSADSSQIVVTPLMRFESDVVVENEVTVRGSKIILLNDLKSLVAASLSFSDFQSRIAALV